MDGSHRYGGFTTALLGGGFPLPSTRAPRHASQRSTDSPLAAARPPHAPGRDIGGVRSCRQLLHFWSWRRPADDATARYRANPDHAARTRPDLPWWPERNSTTRRALTAVPQSATGPRTSADCTGHGGAGRSRCRPDWTTSTPEPQRAPRPLRRASRASRIRRRRVSTPSAIDTAFYVAAGLLSPTSRAPDRARVHPRIPRAAAATDGATTQPSAEDGRPCGASWLTTACRAGIDACARTPDVARRFAAGDAGSARHSTAARSDVFASRPPQRRGRLAGLCAPCSASAPAITQRTHALSSITTTWDRAPRPWRQPGRD